ncbi:MAG: ParB N-terminal domain-containing protein [Kiritimatiellae bacterium]|nr:ParB N-terminal domain-containing protein [Kiritimatiellia bacterium]
MTDTSPPPESGPQRERIVHALIQDLRMPPHTPKNLHAPQPLVESIRIYGILQPLLVRPGPEGYELVAGFKRLQAAKEAGLTEVPVRVYRVEDNAMLSLYDTSNVRGETRHKVSVPPVGEYKPTGKMGGLLEEELNRSQNDIPLKGILTVAGIILLVIWGGLALRNQWKGRSPSGPNTQENTPSSVDSDSPGTDIQPPPASSSDSPTKVSVRRWRSLLAEIDGIEVRDVSGVPRVVFSEPVFSQLVTIDPTQKPRLQTMARLIHEANPGVVLMIIGHTDNDPIRPSSSYRSNEYLSELRAKEVVSFLKETRIFPAGQLRPIALGATDPPFPNNNAADKARNRTVSIEIMQPDR